MLVEFSDWSLTRPGQAPLQLQVYQMLDTPAALGLFSSTQQVWAENGRRREWPLDAATNQRLLAFWRGPFFFLIEASGDDLPLGELEDWAQRVARRVTHPTVYPMTVVQLPEEGLERDSIRFYLSEEALAGHPAFPRSLLGGIDFDQGGEVTAARYRPSGLTLFLIGYPTASLAEEHFASLQKRLESVFSEQGIFLKRSGLLISMVEAPELDARAILDRVRYTATIKWIYEKDTALEDARQRREELVGFFGIVTASILFTGVFILVALTAGALLGLLRYHLLQRYPHLGAKGEMIRLDLDRLKPS